MNCPYIVQQRLHYRIFSKTNRCHFATNFCDCCAFAEKRTKKIQSHLEKAYPDAWLVLHYQNPLELLVATILAAQCTDERVNKVTETLFKKYKLSPALSPLTKGDKGGCVFPNSFTTPLPPFLRGIL